MTIRFTQRMRRISYFVFGNTRDYGKNQLFEGFVSLAPKVVRFFRFIFEQIKFPLYTRKTTTMQCDLVGRLFTNTSASASACVSVCVSEHISRRDLGTDFSQSPT